MKTYTIILFLTIVSNVLCNLMVLTEENLVPVETSNDIFSKNYDIDLFNKHELTEWFTSHNVPTEKYNDNLNGIDNLVEDTICKKETWEFELKDNNGRINHILMMLGVSDKNINLYGEYLSIVQQFPKVYISIHHAGSSSKLSGWPGTSGILKQPWTETKERSLNVDEINMITTRLTTKATNYVNERKQAIGF